jgi:hypothetical protein
MKLAVWLPSICALSLGLLSIVQGCGYNSSQAPAMVTAPPAASHPVTDLSQVAPGNALSPFGKNEQAIARRVTSDDEAASGNLENLGALATVRHSGDDKHPCEQRLLNRKAAQFEMLSMRLQDQVFEQISRLQEGNEISHLKLPTELRRVIITGTMNGKGVLKELVIEQHSGTAAVDKMMVAACKKGLYIHNPPADAVDANGDYKVRIEMRMENFASMDGEHWQFKTYLGLAML